MSDERIIPGIEREEEFPEQKIFGLEAMNDQMERMIAENHRMIDLGDDVEGRQNMIKHLTMEIAVNKRRIQKIKDENGITD